ncbi:hypothetical protein [Pseudomonas sp. N2-5-1-1]|uniref:hypothetical protein n=1 Tax=unclassified Pseudomonas TaxID=196821 RepID=UPI0034E0C4C7
MTNVSKFSPQPIFATHAAAPVVKSAPAPADNPAIGQARNTALPDSTACRATGDAQLARFFASALATRSYQTSGMSPDVQVPAGSTLGRWRAQLDSAFKAPGFLAWAKGQGLDTAGMQLDPARGELAGIVDGKVQTFTLRDDSGWSDVSRTLLSIARVIAPQPGHGFSYPWPEGKVPLYTVGRFYNQPIDLTPAQAALHRKKLANKALFEFAPSAYASLRSAEALAQQQTALGDDADRHALMTALRSQADDANGSIDLDQVMLQIDPRSSRFASEQRRQMSVAQMLRQDGHKVPVNSQQAQGLALALSFDLAHRAPRANAGGARPIAGLLSATSLRKVRATVVQWHKAQVTHRSNPQAGAGSLLRGLISELPPATRATIASNPASALDQLIRSPKARALGQEIQKKIKVIETPTSVIESVSVALVQELDPGMGKSCFNLAGYNLYQRDNAGYSPATIVKSFITHLERKVGVEAAPLAAQLLLAAAAPEFLVKDIPPNLVYGSHTWANFSIEVSRIEQQVPGASGNMTFSQVMAFGEAPLTSLESEDQLSAASGIAIITWGLANGVIAHKPDHNYTYTDVKRSQEALNKQQKELAWARDTLSAPAMTREQLAAAELKRVFPELDPTQKVLQAPWVKHDPVSLLDVYMSGPIKPERWRSLNNKVLPWAAITPRLTQLVPDINQVFSTTFENYKVAHDSAWAIQFKYQLSLLPSEDQARIEQSAVSFIEVSRPFLNTAPAPGLSWNSAEPVSGLSLYADIKPRTPTAQEIEALKGRHGLLMKVAGSAGQASYYSYFPALGRFVKESGFPGEHTNANDGAYFGGSTQGRVPGTYNVYTQYGATHYGPDPLEHPGTLHGTYFSAKSGALGITAASFFTRDYEALKSKASVMTAIEKGKRYDKQLKDFFLGLIPFYDGIQDAIKGDVSGAIFNIGFDILGFALPALNTARKAVKGGQSLGNVIKSSIFSGVGASVGYTDAADIAKNLNRGASAGYKDIKYVLEHGDEVLSRLRGRWRSYDVTKVYKDDDIVKGFHRMQSNNSLAPVVAVFKKGAWYAYNILTNTPFGPQLLQFGVVSAIAPAAK